MIRATIAALVAAFLFGPAYAQQAACGPFPQMTEYLAAKFAEAPIAGGATADGESMVVFLANPQTGTWTLLRVTPTGIACVLVGGDGYTASEYHAPVKGNPT